MQKAKYNFLISASIYAVVFFVTNFALHLLALYFGWSWFAGPFEVLRTAITAILFAALFTTYIRWRMQTRA
jgi:hypothetical protein